MSDLDVIGIQVPYLKLANLQELVLYTQQLVEYIKEVIVEAAKKPGNKDDVTLIVLPEYALSLSPIPSKFKSEIIRQLHQALNHYQTDRNIILIPGTLHHYREEKIGSKKLTDEINFTKTHEEYDERRHIENMLSQENFYRLVNALYILSNNC